MGILSNIVPENMSVPADNLSMETDQIFVEDLVLQARIGVYEHEIGTHQPVVINIELSLSPVATGQEYGLNNIVCYDQICQGIKAIVDRGHIGLIETLAEEIAALCLTPLRAQKVMVKISKPKAIQQAAAAGICITRLKQAP